MLVCVYYVYMSLYFIYNVIRRSSIIIIILLCIYIYISENTYIISDLPVLHSRKPGLLACIYAEQNTAE